MRIVIQSSLCICLLFISMFVHKQASVCVSVCECVLKCVFLFFCIFPIHPVSVEAVLSLTIAGSRQHVAVIKSKEIREKERGGKNVW